MRRSQLEHIIRASAAILDTNELIVIGSQSILGAYPHAPASLTMSMEADLYPPSCPEKSEVLATIGELSPFHDAFNIYADGVRENTATLPEGWKDRLVKVQNENTNGAIGWCLDPIDLAIAKHVAGREKDIEFTEAMVHHGLVDKEAFLERIETVDVTQEHREIIRRRFMGQVERQDRSKLKLPPEKPKGGRPD